MPVEWMGFVLMLAAEPHAKPRRDAEVPLELLEYLADMDKAPAWLRDAPAATELDEPPPSPPPATPRKKKDAQ